MKIFLDTADRDIIKKWVETGIVDGVTTNPSLLSKQGDNPKQVLLDICKMVPGDVSIEVVEKEPQKVYEQAKEISKIAPNVVVKIPFAHEYLPVIAKLTKEKVAINATLIFSVIQALLVAKLNVKYISPFIGRWDDIDVDGMKLLQDLMRLKKNYAFKSEVLAASIRNVMHWHYATLVGTDVITLPPKILDAVMNHPLTTQGIEKFDKDWQSLGKENLLS
ncbi:MAG: transaldolase family protein [bacterium]